MSINEPTFVFLRLRLQWVKKNNPLLYEKLAENRDVSHAELSRLMDVEKVPALAGL